MVCCYLYEVTLHTTRASVDAADVNEKPGPSLFCLLFVVVRGRPPSVYRSGPSRPSFPSASSHSSLVAVFAVRCPAVPHRRAASRVPRRRAPLALMYHLPQPAPPTSLFTHYSMLSIIEHRVDTRTSVRSATADHVSCVFRKSRITLAYTTMVPRDNWLAFNRVALTCGCVVVHESQFTPDPRPAARPVAARNDPGR